MHMFPVGRVVYMPLSTSTATSSGTTTTFLGPVPTDFSSSSTIPLYNTALLSHPFNLCASTKCKFPFPFPFQLMISTGLNIKTLSILHNMPQSALVFNIIMNIDKPSDSYSSSSCCRFRLLRIEYSTSNFIPCRYE